MKTYFIIDSFGARHATIKAVSEGNALSVYKKGMPEDAAYFVLAVPAARFAEFAKNVNAYSA